MDVDRARAHLDRAENDFGLVAIPNQFPDPFPDRVAYAPQE
jgi:hypothetical protein